MRALVKPCPLGGALLAMLLAQGAGPAAAQDAAEEYDRGYTAACDELLAAVQGATLRVIYFNCSTGSITDLWGMIRTVPAMPTVDGRGTLVGGGWHAAGTGAGDGIDIWTGTSIGGGEMEIAPGDPAADGTRGTGITWGLPGSGMAGDGGQYIYAAPGTDSAAGLPVIGGAEMEQAPELYFGRDLTGIGAGPAPGAYPGPGDGAVPPGAPIELRPGTAGSGTLIGPGMGSD